MLKNLYSLRESLTNLSLEKDELQALSAALSACIKDETLTSKVTEYYNSFFDKEKEWSREISDITNPYCDEKLGEDMIFTLVFFLRAFILVEEKVYIFDKKPINFFAPLIRHFRVNIKRNNSFGFKKAQRFWAYCYLKPVSFELGRLAFEILNYNYGYEVYLNPDTNESLPIALPGLKFNKDGLPDNEGSFETTLSVAEHTVSGYTYTEDGHLDFEKKTFSGYKRVLKQGDKVIAIHMPGNSKLSDEAVAASLNGARDFFEKYFPDLDYKAFVSSSWLLDTGLKAFLNENSNILKLQKRFRITLAFKNDFSLFDNIFGVKRCPLDELVPQNRFQHEILDMIKNGRSLYSGRGYILK